jgi:hypothetical protein
MALARGNRRATPPSRARSLSQVRSRSGKPVVTRARSPAFPPELRDYRECLEPARALDQSSVPEIRLLGRLP